MVAIATRWPRYVGKFGQEKGDGVTSGVSTGYGTRPKISKQKYGHAETRLEIFLISEILAVLCYKGSALQVNLMTDPFKTNIQTLQAALAAPRLKSQGKEDGNRV